MRHPHRPCWSAAATTRVRTRPLRCHGRAAWQTFAGATHAFLREQTGHGGANMQATAQAWPLMIAWLEKYTL